MSGHTPGPWETFKGQNTGNIGVNARGAAELFRVAYIPVLPMDGCREEAEANARLIAAAPELLALVERAREELRLLREKDGAGPYDPTLRGHLDAAIAKARGGR